MKYDNKYDILFAQYGICQLLSPSELRDYFIKFKSGDMEARNVIIKGNMRLVFNIIMKYFDNTPYDKNDLISVGFIGLIRAVDSYDLSRKVSFSTFAYFSIKNTIFNFLRDNKKHYNVGSTDQKIIGLDEQEKSILESISDDSVDIVGDYLKKEDELRIRGLLEILDERSRKIIMLYYGFIDDKQFTQAEIAEIVHVSRARVSRIIIQALKKLKVLYENQEDLNLSKL